MPLLVSCVMLTTPGRHRFAERARRCFHSQSYPHRELIEICTAPYPVGPSIGVKRNQGRRAAGGEVVVHWDDDDWSANIRLSTLVEVFLNRPDILLTGYNDILFVDQVMRSAWRYRDNPAYVVGTSMAYRNTKVPMFVDRNVGEDNMLWHNLKPSEVHAQPSNNWLIASIHADKTCNVPEDVARNSVSWHKESFDVAVKAGYEPW